MALFPQGFLEDLKSQTDIVSVIGEVVSLRKTGGTYKGLCPFHEERTPSFNVNPDKGFFKCFGCGVGGDVLKFVELHQKMAFPEAVRYLAARAGIQVPEPESGPEDRAAASAREALIKVHEQALTFYRGQLETPQGARARRELERRGLRQETLATFAYGYAPAAGRDTLHAFLSGQKVPLAVQIQSGLVVDRDGRKVDRFRNRLMIPISRDSGSIVAFGGRALEPGQEPKYLNSPETPIYSKGRTLYGLDVTKPAIRKQNYCVLVEGYFDLAQVWQAGVQNVVASCGTALTGAHAKTLKRFTSKVVLSFDPDTAGQGAAAKSSEMLVAEGFQVNVALLPEGSDPDTFIQTSGGQAYVERLKTSRPYLEFLMDRAAERLDPNQMESRKRFLDEMLTVAASIPDAGIRDQFADRLAHKARVTETVVRDEIRKAASQRKTQAPAIAVPLRSQVRAAEQGLLWSLVHRPVEALAALARLDADDRIGLISAPILELAATLADVPPDVLPELVRERLSEGERALLDQAAALEAPPGSAVDCVGALRRMRYDRERADLQDAIDRLQDEPPGPTRDARLRELWDRKKDILQRLEDLR
jgi:DNA primase